MTHNLTQINLKLLFMFVLAIYVTKSLTKLMVMWKCQNNNFYLSVQIFSMGLPPNPQEHVMSQRCEQPLDELTVQVWLLMFIETYS